MRHKLSDAVLVLNTHFNQQALNVIEYAKQIYGNRDGIGRELNLYLHGQGDPYDFKFNELKKAYQNYTQNTGLFLSITIQKHIQPLLRAYRNILGKISSTFNYFMTEPNLDGSMAVYLTFGQVDRYMRNFLSNKWNGISPIWIRNSLVGWKRKFDKDLPKQLQPNNITRIFHKLGNYLRGFIINKDFYRLISTLEKIKILHLFFSDDINIELFLTDDLWDIARSLKNDSNFKNYFYNFDFSDFHSISTYLNDADLENGCSRLLDSVENNLYRLEKASLTNTPSYKNTETFKNKILYLSIELKKQKYKIFLENYFANQEFTNSLSKALKNNSIEHNKLYSALRGIIAFAYAQKYNYSDIVEDLNGFDPSKCATFPFCSPTRKSDKISFATDGDKPIRFKGINNEKLNYTEATENIRNNTDVFLTFPTYRDSSIIDGLITQHSRAENVIKMKFIPTKPIKERIDNGAEISSLRFGISKAPFYNVPIYVTLGAKSRDPFSHPTKYFKNLEPFSSCVNSIENNVLGSDFNALGEYALAVGKPTQEIDITSLTNALDFEQINHKLDKYRDCISNYQYDILKEFSTLNISQEVIVLAQQLLINNEIEVSDNNIKMIIANTEYLLDELQNCNKIETIRLIKNKSTQIQLLYRKSKRIYKDFAIKFVMLFVYVGNRVGARNYGWDDISQITTRGLRGKLAQIVTYLPRKKGLRGLFKEWLEDLYGDNFNIFNPSPYTSSICGKCGKKTMEKINDLYVECQNVNCGYRANRHHNASCVNAQKVIVLMSKVKSFLIDL